jgi:uncharacterized protein YcfL
MKTVAKIMIVVMFWTAVMTPFMLVGCQQQPSVTGVPVSVSGIKEIKPEVKTGSDGLTNEQRNIKDRYLMDSTPGSIKHLYIISAYSGDVIIYSTVRGKVTSSGKRLSPGSVYAGNWQWGESRGMTGIEVNIGGTNYRTSVVLQDDGTYGGSIEYLYWFDSKGIYHQHYVAGGQIVHISNEPLAVKRVIINMEQTKSED